MSRPDREFWISLKLLLIKIINQNLCQYFLQISVVSKWNNSKIIEIKRIYLSGMFFAIELDETRIHLLDGV